MIGGRDTNEPADPSVPELELHPADRHVQTLEELLEDRQGLMLYHHLPNWPEDRIRPLMETFGSMLIEQRVYREVFGVI